MQQKIKTSNFLKKMKNFFKWLWLMLMFLLGIAIFVLIPFGIFEYSFSFLELDFVEILFLFTFVKFVYKYIKLCLRVDVPLVYKVITPCIHQAYLALIFTGFIWPHALFFRLQVDDFTRMPMLDLVGYILMVMTLYYSYGQIESFSNPKSQATKVREDLSASEMITNKEL